jgi:hypothetical protein
MVGITASWQRNCVKLLANLARRERGTADQLDKRGAAAGSSADLC